MENQNYGPDGQVTALATKGEAALQEKKKGLLASLSSSKKVQKVFYDIMEKTGGLGIDWANSLFQKVLKSFGLFEKFSKTLYWTAFTGLRVFGRAAWKFKVYGEMFPEYGTGIVCANHVSHLDPFFVGMSVHRRVVWMSKVENFETPIIKSIFSNFGAFPVYRGQGDQKAMERARKVMASGDWLGLFPEGTRSVVDEMGQFKTGAIRLAIEQRVPIVPVVTAGLEKVLPKKSFFMKFGVPVSTLVGRPITYEDYYDTNPTYYKLQQLAGELRDVMLEMKEEIDGIHSLRDGTAFKAADRRLSIGYPARKE